MSQLMTDARLNQDVFARHGFADEERTFTRRKQLKHSLNIEMFSDIVAIESKKASSGSEAGH
jgi:hypothetical protein